MPSDSESLPTGSVSTGALSAVVLAAGEGTRMRSERPKPLHRLCGRPLVLHVLHALAELDLERAEDTAGKEQQQQTDPDHDRREGEARVGQ